MPPSDEQYRILFTFRRALRQFLRTSEALAHHEGLTNQQEQLLLCVRGHPGPEPPRMSDLAGHLMIRLHSAVGLVNRSAAMGLVVRHPDAVDQRVVRISLTPKGHGVLDRLTSAQLAELEAIAGKLRVSEDFLTALSEEFLSGSEQVSAPGPG